MHAFCKTITYQHKEDVKKLVIVLDILQYDYTKDYPTIINYKIN